MFFRLGKGGCRLCNCSVERLYSGFLPTAIRTVADVPCWTSTFSPTFFWFRGDMFSLKLRLKSTAARTCIGHAPMVNAWRAGSGRSESTDTKIPSLRHTGTANSWSLPYTLIAGNPAGGGTRFHAALCNRLSICLSRSIASDSEATQENVYSESLNCFNAKISSSVWSNDRGVLIWRSSSSWSRARLSASVSSRLLYGKPISSRRTAPMNNPTAHFSNVVLDGQTCLAHSHPAHARNPMMEENSSMLWASLTNSGESHPGGNVIHRLLSCLASVNRVRIAIG